MGEFIKDIETESTWNIRTQFFQNIIAGVAGQNQEMERNFFLDFQYLKKRKYLDLERITEEHVRAWGIVDSNGVIDFNLLHNVDKIQKMKEALKVDKKNYFEQIPRLLKIITHEMKDCDLRATSPGGDASVENLGGAGLKGQPDANDNIFIAIGKIADGPPPGEASKSKKKN